MTGTYQRKVVSPMNHSLGYGALLWRSGWSGSLRMQVHQTYHWQLFRNNIGARTRS